jgi:hypothetical protein
MTMGTAKGSVQPRRPRKGLERAVLNSALEKYRPGQPIFVGGENLLKPALRLMSLYRLRIEKIKGAALVTSYTRMRPNEGSRKSGSLFNVQSELRAHLVRIEEAAA